MVTWGDRSVAVPTKCHERSVRNCTTGTMTMDAAPPQSATLRDWLGVLAPHRLRFRCDLPGVMMLGFASSVGLPAAYSAISAGIRSLARKTAIAFVMMILLSACQSPTASSGELSSEQLTFIRTGGNGGSYIEGTARSLGVIETERREVVLVYYETEIPAYVPGIDPGSRAWCVAVVEPEGLPHDPTCSGMPEGDVPADRVGGVSHEVHGEVHELLVEHSPGAVWLTVSTSDGRTVRTRSTGVFSYAEWEGGGPVSLTVTWSNGNEDTWLGFDPSGG